MTVFKADKLIRSEWVVIGLLYFVATLININKAYHIDDTFHLEAANWIKQHPFRPMSGLINWDENKEPMYMANQPPLYFYFVALVSSLVGNAEVSMHLFQSIFTFFSLLLFYKITQRLALKRPLLLTTLFTFCPAFLVNQNLMVDVPLLCFDLWFLDYLLKPDVRSEPARYWKASLILSLSLLIKYTNIPLLVVLLAALLWRKQYRLLYVVFIPVGVLGLWSLWNYAEFSAVHLINRPRNSITMSLFGENVLAFVTCLGAIAPFTLALLTGYLSRYRIIHFFIPVVAMLFVGLTIATAKHQLFILTSNDILASTFLLNGLLLIGLVLGSVWRNAVGFRKTITTTDVILLVWIVSVSGFIILFAPFVASRHVLLIIPPVLFLGGRWLDSISLVNAGQAILAAAAISLILAISDWQFADFYRQKAKEAADLLPRHSRIWTTGHWGWQWYAQQNGFKEVQADSMQFRQNDYLVQPSGVDQQRMPLGVHLRLLTSLTTPLDWKTFISTSYYGCFYGRGTGWAYSNFPIDDIKIYRIIGVPIEPERIATMKRKDIRYE